MHRFRSKNKHPQDNLPCCIPQKQPPEASARKTEHTPILTFLFISSADEHTGGCCCQTRGCVIALKRGEGQSAPHLLSARRRGRRPPSRRCRRRNHPGPKRDVIDLPSTTHCDHPQTGWEGVSGCRGWAEIA